MTAKTKKPTDANPTLVREFFREELPLIPSGTPTKPGPIHISNVLLAHALGEGSLKNRLPEILKGGSDLGELFGDLSSELSGDAEQLRVLLQTIFDTDGNVFPKFSSPFPITKEFVFKDSSDNGYGRGLWDSFGEPNRIEITNLLEELLNEDPGDHALANLLRKLTKDSNSTTSRISSFTGSTQFGENAGKILIQGLKKGCGQPMHVRIEILKQFSVLLGSFVVIGMMYDSCSKLSNNKIDIRPSDVLGTFCFTGNTAGRTKEERQLAQLAIISLRDTIDRTYQGIEKCFLEKVEEKRELFPKDDWSTLSLKIATEKLTLDSAKRMTESLIYFGESGVDKFIPNVYPKSNIRSAIKSLGHKCGLIWPIKSGEPRIVLDSVFVNSLVSFMGEPDMPLFEFSELIFHKLGLVFGYSGVSDEVIERLEEVTSHRLDIVDLLTKSEKRLSTRLVTAGLARQYSDGSAAIVGGLI